MSKDRKVFYRKPRTRDFEDDKHVAKVALPIVIIILTVVPFIASRI